MLEEGATEALKLTLLSAVGRFHRPHEKLAGQAAPELSIDAKCGNFGLRSRTSCSAINSMTGVSLFSRSLRSEEGASSACTRLAVSCRGGCHLCELVWTLIA